jgi:hypothetical protein
MRSATIEARSSADCILATRLSRVSAKACVGMRSSRRAGISFSGGSDIRARYRTQRTKQELTRSPNSYFASNNGRSRRKAPVADRGLDASIGRRAGLGRTAGTGGIADLQRRHGVPRVRLLRRWLTGRRLQRALLCSPRNRVSFSIRSIFRNRSRAFIAGTRRSLKSASIAMRRRVEAIGLARLD